MAMNKNISDQKKWARSWIYQKTTQRTPEIKWKTQDRKKSRSRSQIHYYQDITWRWRRRLTFALYNSS